MAQRVRLWKIYISLVNVNGLRANKGAQTCCANIGANNLTAAAFVAKAALGK
jgi:hypothetical protein